MAVGLQPQTLMLVQQALCPLSYLLSPLAAFLLILPSLGRLAHKQIAWLCEKEGLLGDRLGHFSKVTVGQWLLVVFFSLIVI